jgi:hypothetical protein
VRRVGAMANLSKEPLLEIFGAAELVAQHPESTGAVAEATRCFGRRKAFDEISSQCLVLAMQGVDWLKEKASLSRTIR